MFQFQPLPFGLSLTPWGFNSGGQTVCGTATLSGHTSPGLPGRLLDFGPDAGMLCGAPGSGYGRGRLSRQFDQVRADAVADILVFRNVVRHSFDARFSVQEANRYGVVVHCPLASSVTLQRGSWRRSSV